MIFALTAAAALFQAAPVVDKAGPWPTTCGVAPQSTQIVDPLELRSHQGFLNLTLSMEGQRNPLSTQILCFVYQRHTNHGVQRIVVPPTLHLLQGDRLVLTLLNDVLEPKTDVAAQGPALSIDRGAASDGMADDGGGVGLMCGQPQLLPTPPPNPRTGRIYGYHRSPWNEANLHFHGLNTSPKPPGDDVVNVLLCPRKTLSQTPRSYTYVVDIPRDEPPGLYWYHPHAHGESEHQVQRGLTGAIIVDPRVAAVPQQIPNRVIVVRDYTIGDDGIRHAPLNARLAGVAAPDFNDIRAQVTSGLPDVNDGSAAFRYRFGNPAPCPPGIRPDIPNFNTRELTVNGIELPLGIIPPALGTSPLQGLPHTMIPAGQTQFWRLANTASDTVLDLELKDNGKVVPLQVVSRDGVPLIEKNGHPTWQPVPMNDVIIAPAGRVEFYLTGTSSGDRLVVRTRAFDAGCLGDAEYGRDLFLVRITPAQGVPRVQPPRAIDPIPTRFSDLGLAAPDRHRTFVFTEYPRNDEPEPDFYITEISNPEAVETPFTMDEPPAVVVKDGTVEDWTLLNYTQEVHEFHIHQIHFLVVAGDGIAGGQSQILDTVNVPYGVFKNGGKHGSRMTPGMVRLRMDFRAKDIIGTFVYHCHLLEHEDNGMMAKIRVVP